MALTIPVRFVDGVGNVPAAANWNDDFDWVTALAYGIGFLSNGGQEKWTTTTFTNPANGTALSTNWTEVKSGTTPCTADVTREASIIDTGLYSMKVNITGAGSSDSYWAIKQSLPNPSGFGSLTLVAGVRIKVATASKVRVKIYDGTNTAYSSFHTGDGTWQLLQAKLAAVASPSEVTMTIEINPANFTDAVYMDSGYVYVVPSAISARALASLVYSPIADVVAGEFLQISGGTMTGAIAMGSNKITGLAAATSNGDALRYEQLFGGDVTLIGNLIFNPTTKGVKGTTTNDNAAALNVGEYVSATVARTSPVTGAATGTYKDLQSISLTAGDWDITIVTGCETGSGQTGWETGIGTTSGNSSLGANYGDNLLQMGGITVGFDAGTCIAVWRVSISATTTYYHKILGFFPSGTTPAFYGRMSARRVR